MLNKLVLAAIATSIALPVAASEISPGRAMIADLLNLDAAAFSLNELEQISSEETEGERADRAKFILEQRNYNVEDAVASDDSIEDFFRSTRSGRDS